MGRGSSKAGRKLDTAHPSGSGGGMGAPGDNFSSNALGIQAPKTLREALGKKGRAMSEERAAGAANPYYNRNYGEFSENCQRAVVAYELRRRGYDVTAQPTYSGDKMGETAFTAKNGRRFLRLTGAFQGAKTENVGASTGGATLNNIRSKMKGYGNGSRAIMVFGWRSGRTGHAINVEYKNGKVHFNDAQIGKKYDANELMNAIKTSTVAITRTDNLKISERAKKSVERAGSRN